MRKKFKLFIVVFMSIFISVSTITNTPFSCLKNNDESINNFRDIGDECIVSALSKVEKVNKGKDAHWNTKMINVYKKGKKTRKKVKVALIDSGVDILEQDDLSSVHRKDFIGDDYNPLLEDYSGHGTSISSILIGNSKEGSVLGINPNIELYSARVLDENMQAPVSRVVRAINWAIDMDVNIISISFGTEEYSSLLQNVIDKAVDNDILVVAAAGNGGRGSTYYPASFDNVLSVGSVNSQAEISEFTSIGKQIDVVAPGEAIRVNGPFGAEIITSGTSMATPHVVGLASLIWEKNLDKSANFIKKIILQSSKKIGDSKIYGNGLVDFEKAEEIYDKLETGFVENSDVKVEVYDNGVDENKVNGVWSKNDHMSFVNPSYITNEYMKLGATVSDSLSSVAGMNANPEFHGYYHRVNNTDISSDNELVNYLACYRYMIKIGNAYGNGTNYMNLPLSDFPGLKSKDYNNIRTKFMSFDIESVSSSYANRKAYVFGIAMHTATDAFSHSTFHKNSSGNWTRIVHTNSVNDSTHADNPSNIPARFTMAKRVGRNVIYRFQGKRSDVAVCHDFHAAGDTNGTYYGNMDYRIANISKYAKEVKISDVNVIKHYGIINYDIAS